MYSKKELNTRAVYLSKHKNEIPTTSKSSNKDKGKRNMTIM